MKVKLLIIKKLSLFLLFLASTITAQKGLFIGTIQFPTCISAIPNIRVYYAGQRINGETDDDAKKVIFSIPELKEKSFFYMLVSSDLEFGSHENTVPYLQLKKGASYKFFALQRVAYEPAVKKRNSRSVEYGWFVQELSRAIIDGKIPDETIIVRYNPEYIHSFSGGNMIELPKIVIKPDILTLVGSEDKLHALSNKWFLAALNTDAIHAPIQSAIVLSSNPKTVITMVT